MSAEMWVRIRADKFLRHGGKTSRRATIRRLITIIKDIQQHEPGVRRPEWVGKAHIHRYYERHSHLAVSTQRDYYYAVKLLWQWLDRRGNPPKPCVLNVV